MLSNLEIIGSKKFSQLPNLGKALGCVWYGFQGYFMNLIIFKLDNHVLLLINNAECKPGQIAC